MELSWDESYATGIEKIDKQHQELFAIVNELSAALVLGRANNSVGAVLKRLTEYASCHFATEEELMRKYDYPLTNQHMEEHKRFTQQMTDLVFRHRDGKILVHVQTYTVLRDYILNHICDEEKVYDQGLGQYLLDHPDSIVEYLPEDQFLD